MRGAIATPTLTESANLFYPGHFALAVWHRVDANPQLPFRLDMLSYLDMPIKHGDAKKNNQHPLYIVWCGMKQRCEDKNCRLYPRWGGRGILINWKSYEEFKGDMQDEYQPGLQIERKDNNGPYSKDNCTWATPQQQALNRRSNVILELNGVRQSVSVWADQLGVKRQMIESRIKKGWSDKDVLLTPVGAHDVLLTFQGQTLRQKDWARKLGIKNGTLSFRMRNGWTVEQALTTPIRKRNG